MNEITAIDTNEIIPGNNDRTVFSPDALQELAASIREHGLIQPITVRWIDDAEAYQIIAGERRYRACKLLGWQTVPSIIVDATDEQASALMLAENVARADLDPIDEAIAYQTRIDLFGWTVQEIADRAGVSPIRVQFRLKLLRLRPDVQKLVRDGHLSIGYAQILCDANLDTNRQLIAFRYLRDNPAPTPGWFRRQVNDLLAEQSQDALFDFSSFIAPTETQHVAIEEPAHPSTTRPPTRGSSLREILRNQAGFWSQAAEAWDKLGKPFKRQECEAAAQALTLALSAI
jgi:ParB/RepB/Spo0J family partition protein